MTQGPADTERTMVMSSTMLAAIPQVEPREQYLMQVEGSQIGWRLHLGERPVRMGRHAGSDVPLADHEVSGQHCEVSVQPGAASLRVRDLGSTNGTFVLGQRVAPPLPTLRQAGWASRWCGEPPSTWPTNACRAATA